MILTVKNVAAAVIGKILAALPISSVSIEAAPELAAGTFTQTEYAPAAYDNPLDNSKAAYNLAIDEARKAATKALEIRREIVRDNPQYRGPSMGHLRLAVLALYNATTFDGFLGDIPADENDIRDTGAYDIDSIDLESVKSNVC